MTDTTPAPLREQVADAIHRVVCMNGPLVGCPFIDEHDEYRYMADAALAVVWANLPERRPDTDNPTVSTLRSGWNACLNEIEARLS